MSSSPFPRRPSCPPTPAPPPATGRVCPPARGTDFDHLARLPASTVSELRRALFESLSRFLEGAARCLPKLTDADLKGAAVHIEGEGPDADHWVAALRDLYARWAADRGLEARLVAGFTHPDGGMTFATLHLPGRLAYGRLRGECGVHRLTFEVEGVARTVAARVDVLPDLRPLAALPFPEADIFLESFPTGFPARGFS